MGGRERWSYHAGGALWAGMRRPRNPPAARLPVRPEHALQRLERGLHVLSEKPIARNEGEARSMVEAARAAGRVLHVGFNHRERGDIHKLKDVIDAGRLGTPYYAKAWWLRRSGIPGLGSWFTMAELAGGGPLVDIGVHVLDYSLFLLGNPTVIAVSASTYDLLASAGFGFSLESDKTSVPGSTGFDVEDLATVFMRLQDGGTLLVEGPDGRWRTRQSWSNQWKVIPATTRRSSTCDRTTSSKA